MRALIWSGLAHKYVNGQAKNPGNTRARGYAWGLWVAHANLSELAVPRINAGRIPVSRGEINRINLRRRNFGRTMTQPPRLYGGMFQHSGGHHEP